jgi:sugar phosphate isomerase/epimerase
MFTSLVLTCLALPSQAPPPVSGEVELPAHVFGVEPFTRSELAEEAQRLLESRTWRVRSRPSWRLEGERFVSDVAQELLSDEGSFGLELIRRGLVHGHFGCDDDKLGPDELEAALAAAREAQAARVGLFAELPEVAPMEFPLAGVALPMHYKQTTGNYGWELREIKALGAEWVNLLVVTRQADVEASFVPFSSPRTPTDARIRATIRLARRLGLRVQLMPIVLLREAGPKDWRGTLRPTEADQWWRSYDRFVCHMADLAAEAGAEAFSVGSEFASLEKYESSWRRLIANVRLRFPGHLTYSANWDHFASVPFWDALDFVSMTAYFTLCPRVEVEGTPPDAVPLPFADLASCVRSGWRTGLDELVRLSLIAKKPAVFSEVGVPSVEGALAGPWNYTLDAAPDPTAQALAFRVFQDVFLPDGQPADHFGGCFLYDYWGLGGLEDKKYTPRGKPAAAEWRKILRALAGSESR